MSDAELIVRSRADARLFALIFDRHFVTIHRYLVHRVGPDVADDLAGEVFRIAFERRDIFDAQQVHARPWLYGIATNLLHGARRSEHRRLRALQRTSAATRVQPSEDPFERAIERVDAEVMATRLASAVADLTAADRDALVLFAVEGLTYREVAAALAVPIGTVRSRISRARYQLRELLDAGGQQRSDWPEAEETCSG